MKEGQGEIEKITKGMLEKVMGEIKVLRNDVKEERRAWR